MDCKKLCFLVLTIILAGCQYNSVYINPVHAYTVIKPGSKLSLNKALTIPANKARVYIQGGAVITDNAVDRYYPNCSLEVKTIKQTAQIIETDTFNIIKVRTDEEDASISRLIYASRLFVSDDGGAISHQNWVTHFYLQSSKQPDVFRLSCAHWEDPPEARHLTLAEIKAALGNYMTFNN